MVDKKKFGFQCEHCHTWVTKDEFIGTHFRNHCPFCLWSKHVDWKSSGDRQANCRGLMKPVGLTFKKEGVDKYGHSRQGELMLIHQCETCFDFSINRLAADDSPQAVLTVFEESQRLSSAFKKNLQDKNIKLLDKKDEKEIKIQLFGKKI